ncbi:ABC transporter ATP-binding protein [Klenkia sp. LSe6-5]|uniref:ABC transporter ATP-binding protein n=1 Tax=Klenkia sesuvii TaxID=3103137 RepID=A0ABU8DRK4_9ACTN
MSTTPTATVTFEGVSKTYADGTIAVDNLDLVCPAGKITVFVGPSGCGKTTSLRMINRMITPSAGRVLLADQDVSFLDAAALRRQMGYVIQSAGLFPHRTIEDNIGTVPVLLGSSRRQARQQAADLMARVGLDPSMARRYPYQLSGGQQQRVGVARALAADPPVLLMDEPFSAVDPMVRHDLQLELLRLQTEIGKTIVFVTHDIDEAVTLGDQIAVFQRGGHLTQVAGPETLLAEPADAFVDDFMGTDKGVKWLSFIAADDVPLHQEGVTPAGHPVAVDHERWQLVVDDEQRPTGWVAPGETSEQLRACRRTFRPDRDQIRAALDSALLSPAGLAVAVDSEDRVLGLASHADLATSIRAARTQR